jgi:hypothetical protein
MKKHQNGHENIVFDVMSEVQKDLEDVSAETGQFKKIQYIRIFSRIQHQSWRGQL